MCAICGDKPSDLTLHVDHHHETGVVRKLLCVRCNNALGLFQESHELFQAAADYLNGHDPAFVELVALARQRALALAQRV